MSNTNFSAPRHRRFKNHKGAYYLAHTCGVSWLISQGYALAPDRTSPKKLAELLGLPHHNSNAAMCAVVNWHRSQNGGAPPPPVPALAADENFYRTQAWRKARYEALRASHGRCALCGDTGETAPLHVDHIKPRSLFPLLALDPRNLQVLCRDCNLGKGNKDAVDWREVMSVDKTAPLADDLHSDESIGRMLRELR